MTPSVIRFCAAFLSAGLLHPLQPAPAAAQDNNAAMPQTLVIGYEEEGKVDASPAACRTFVTETVEWDQAETAQAIKDVCAYRRKHLDAYAAFQASYAGLRDILQEQTRFDGVATARHLAAIVKSCIDMKWSLSTGGHNIGMDMVPNAIATACLDLGREIADQEAQSLTPRDDSQMGGE